MNKVSKRYIKDIRLFLKLYGKTERTFLRKMKERIQYYQTEHEGCSYEDLVEEFGTPPEVAAAYLNESDEKILYKRMRIRTWLKAVVAVLLALLLSYTIWDQCLLYAGHVASRNSDTGKEYIYYEKFEEDK